MATLSYAYRDATVWVDDLAAEAHPMTHDLCEDHAANLRVPRGWDRRDRRQRPLVVLGQTSLLSA